MKLNLHKAKSLRKDKKDNKSQSTEEQRPLIIKQGQIISHDYYKVGTNNEYSTDAKSELQGFHLIINYLKKRGHMTGVDAYKITHESTSKHNIALLHKKIIITVKVKAQGINFRNKKQHIGRCFSTNEIKNIAHQIQPTTIQRKSQRQLGDSSNDSNNNKKKDMNNTIHQHNEKINPNYRDIRPSIKESAFNEFNPGQEVNFNNKPRPGDNLENITIQRKDDKNISIYIDTPDRCYRTNKTYNGANI